MKRVLLIVFCLATLTISMFGCASLNDSEQGRLKVKIVDITNGKEIEEGKLIITDIGKEIVLTTDNNTINIPYKKITKKNGYVKE